MRPKKTRGPSTELRYTGLAQKKRIHAAAKKLQMSANAFITRSADEAASAVLKGASPLPLPCPANGSMLQASGE